MKKRHAFLAGVIILFSTAPVRANDGVGSVALGEIVLGKTHRIAMQREVLEIGWKEIKVDYDFINESDQDVTENIVFPLPEYGCSGDSPSYAGRPGGFRVEVDGKPVRYQTHVEALFRDESGNQRNVTPQLRLIGLSDPQIALFPWMQVFGNAGFTPRPVSEIPVFTGQQITRLRQKGLITEGFPGVFPQGMPIWDVQVTYSWRQAFPAHRKVHVHHRYAPFVSVGSHITYIQEEELKRRFGADEAFMKVWRRLSKKDKTWGGVPATSVAYILKTANTWKDGVRDFTLRLQKSRPQEIVSLTFPGTPRWVNRTTLEFRHTNFRPAQDLEIYFGNVSGNLYEFGEYTGEPPLMP